MKDIGCQEVAPDVKEKQTPSTEPGEYHWTMDGIRREAEPKHAVVPLSTSSGEEDLPKETDQRRFPRIDLQFPVLYRILPEEPLVASGAATADRSAGAGNISPTGACLVLAEKLPRGATIALSLHSGKAGALSAVGKVVWSKPTETAHHYLTGLEFVVVYRKTRTKTEYLDSDILKGLLGTA